VVDNGADKFIVFPPGSDHLPPDLSDIPKANLHLLSTDFDVYYICPPGGGCFSQPKVISDYSGLSKLSAPDRPIRLGNMYFMKKDGDWTGWIGENPKSWMMIPGDEVVFLPSSQEWFSVIEGENNFKIIC